MYVGLTTTALNIRYNNHRLAARKNKNFKVSKHFYTHGVENMSIGILETDATATAHQLKVMEAFWINTLDTINNGLNSKDESITVLNQHAIKAVSHFTHSAQCTPYIVAHIEENRQLKPKD